MKMTNKNIEISFSADDLQEGLTLSESFSVNNIPDHAFKWHSILTKTDAASLDDMKEFKLFKQWGIDFNEESLKSINSELASKRKRFTKTMRKIKDIRESKEFEEALEKTRAKFGHVLKDGTTFFEYQLQDIALSYFKTRCLSALEMGMGKTRTNLAFALCQDSNEKILIITMSRNLNDWVREIKNLGYEDDYILLDHPRDLNNKKRIHLVSYEKWSNKRGRTVFRQKVHHACPECETSYRNSFFSKVGYCTVCKHKAKPLTERWTEKDLPTFCPDCRSEWDTTSTTCQNKVTKHKKVVKCGYSVIEEEQQSLHEFYKPYMYDACIVDEIHYIKNGNTSRSQAVRKIKSKVKVALSGTPAENGTADLFWILGWLTDFSNQFDDPSLRRDNPSPFRGYGQSGLKSFTAYFGGGSKVAVLDIDSINTRISNHEKLWDLLDTLMIRRKKTDTDVKTDVFVPKPIHHRYHINMDTAERQLYNHILEGFAEWYALEVQKKEAAAQRGDKYKINTIEICSWMRKLQQAASCPWIFPEYDVNLGSKTAKYKYMEQKIIEKLRVGKKVLVFSGHKETVEQLSLSLDQVVYGKEAAYIHGDVKKEDRWALIERFQDPKDPLCILVLSQKTGAESYTLTESKAVFLFDLDFNGKRMEQCYSRAVRLTQKDVVDVYWLMNSDTIDCNIHALCLSKISGVDQAIDRVALDFEEISKEFEGDLSLGSHELDYEEFAKNMLASGTSRHEYEKYA